MKCFDSLKFLQILPPVPIDAFKCGKGKYKHLNLVLCIGVTILSFFTF